MFLVYKPAYFQTIIIFSQIFLFSGFTFILLLVCIEIICELEDFFLFVTIFE